MSVQGKLEQELKEFQKLQKGKIQYNTLFIYLFISVEYSKAVSNRQQLESQLRENEMVKKEFDLITSDSQIYKLVGPLLMKQEQSEAKANVAKRLDYINGEIGRVDVLLKELSEKQEKKRQQVRKYQFNLK